MELRKTKLQNCEYTSNLEGYVQTSKPGFKNPCAYPGIYFHHLGCDVFSIIICFAVLLFA